MAKKLFKKTKLNLKMPLEIVEMPLLSKSGKH